MDVVPLFIVPEVFVVVVVVPLFIVPEVLVVVVVVPLVVVVDPTIPQFCLNYESKELKFDHPTLLAPIELFLNICLIPLESIEQLYCWAT